jgi:diguanylate cyclase (GGDEF)-like protein
VSDAWLIYGNVTMYGTISLVAFVACIVMVYRLLSEMIAWQDEANRRLEKAAQTDAMTGLLNKASTEEAVSHAVRRGTGALLVIDLDNFKPVNDLYGHEMGDRVLIRFAELIQSAIRDGDIAGRIGGDEFAVFCEGLTDEQTIVKKCDFLNSEIVASAEEYMGSDMGIPLGCSMGVALVPKDGREYGMLFAKADLSLHHTKRGSKHGVRIFREQDKGPSEKNKGDLSNLRMIFGERNPRKTALVAERELFQDIYQSMVRLASANGWNLHLVEFTLQREEDSNEEGLSGCTDQFVELSANLLRNSDVILKYNDSQVVFLLMEPDNGDYTVPINRVLNAWEREGVPGVTISHQQEQVNE